MCVMEGTMVVATCVMTGPRHAVFLRCACVAACCTLRMGAW